MKSYLPITKTHKETYYPDLNIPYFPTPMGFDFSEHSFYEKHIDSSEPIRFVYIGAVSKLRFIEKVNQAFLSMNEDFIFDYYSADDNEETDKIKAIDDKRIRFHGALPRVALYEEIKSADLGVCFFPHTKTYITASPTKTLEYAALGLTPFINDMPEYKGLFNEKSAFICDFNNEDMSRTLKTIIKTPKEELKNMGREAYQLVKEKRSYNVLGEKLNDFLAAL